MALVLTIDGVDFHSYLKAGAGYQWKRMDVDSEKAGRSTLDGSIERDRIAVKQRLDCECRPLNRTEVYTLLHALAPEYVSVTYTDPSKSSGTSTKTLYSNNPSVTLRYSLTQKGELWEGLKFPLVEK